ncbi:MAG TPA: hypothetical protein VKP04_00200, partial [Ktedonobacteraceae bacterium]|nr:hypothetical protein [Ktedonobacteraceae bacterium]
MNQCLSCNKPCAATAVFCDNCRAALLNRQQERGKFTQVFPPGVQAQVEQIQINYKPHPSSQEDLPSKKQPKMYRPFQRSTILASSQDANRLVPAISPELEKAEEDHSESDDSMQQSDPLMTRHLPTSASAAQSDEEELQPVHSAGKKPTTVPLPIFQRYVRSRPLRMAFITLVVAIVLALIVDAMLITFIIHRDTVHVPTSGGVLNTPHHVAVSLTVQPRLPLHPTPGAQSTSPTPPAPGTSTSTALSPGEPILDMATSNLTFTYTQGQGNPGSQEATLANMGGSAFSWQASVSSSASAWLSLDSNAGTVAAAQSVQVGVSVNP